MKQFILRAFVALVVLCGILTFTKTCFAATPDNAYNFYPPIYNYNPQVIPGYNPQAFPGSAYVYPPIGAQVMPHPATPTQIRTGYTRSEIRSMPMVARPNRPGHFIGNTVRRRAGVGY